MTSNRKWRKTLMLAPTSLLLLGTPSCLSVSDSNLGFGEGYLSDSVHRGKPSDLEDVALKAQSAIDEALNQDWMAVYQDGAFRPYERVTREGFAYILYRSILATDQNPQRPDNGANEGPTAAEDVDTDRWSRAAIESLVAWQIIRPLQNFFPEVAITREEASLWVFSALQGRSNGALGPRNSASTDKGHTPGFLFLDTDAVHRGTLAKLTSVCPAFDLSLSHPALFKGNTPLNRQDAALWAQASRSCAETMEIATRQSGYEAATQSTSTADGNFETVCDVVVNGGTLAGLSSALTSAQSGKVTCLIEPLSYPAGYWLSAAEPVSIPEPKWKMPGQRSREQTDDAPFADLDQFLSHAQPINDAPSQTSTESAPIYISWLRKSGAVECAERQLCFKPAEMLRKVISQQINAQPTLFVFTDARIVSTSLNGTVIDGVTLEQQLNANAPPSPDSHASIRVHIKARSEAIQSPKKARENSTQSLVVIEASPLGDLLVLSKANWFQGMESMQAIEPGADQCGSAFGFAAFAQVPDSANADAKREQGASAGNRLDRASEIFRPGVFNGKDWSPQDLASALTAWPIKERRRSKQKKTKATPETIAYFYQDNGNIFARQSYLKSREEAITQSLSPAGWRGGLNQQAIEQARETLNAWFRFLSTTTRKPIRPVKGYFPLDAAAAPLPRVTTGRRGLGWNGFQIAAAEPTKDVLAWAIPRTSFHGLQTCSYPKIFHSTEALPKRVPISLRGMISNGHPNLLLSGPALAADFFYSHLLSSTDAHWKSGLLAGSLAVTLLEETGDALSITKDPNRFINQSSRLWAPLLKAINQ
jgi:hypothetical protein